MCHKIRISCCTLMVLLMVWCGSATGDTYLGYEEHGGTWIDTNKTWDDDSYMCWAAAACNILEWGRWEVAEYNSASLIFENFKYHWVNWGGEVPWAYDWWFSGTSYYGQVVVPGGGNYWPAYNAWDLYHSDTGNTMQSIDSYLRAGYGVTLGITTYLGRHAMTVWGFDYDPRYAPSDDRYYTHLHVTDSNDGPVGLRRFAVSKGELGWWYFDDGDYPGCRIDLAEGMERRWVMEFAPIYPSYVVINKFDYLKEVFKLHPFLSFDYKFEPPFPDPQPGDPCLFKILIQTEEGWLTLFEIALTQGALEQGEPGWQSVNIEIPKEYQGLQTLWFLMEGDGSIRMYRLNFVPVPATVWLLGSGLLGLFGLKRWRKKS